MTRRTGRSVAVFSPGPIERGTAELARVIVDGKSLPDLALTAAKYADEFADQAAKSPAERVLVSRVTGMLENAALQAVKKWRNDGNFAVALSTRYFTTADFAALVHRSPGTVRRWRQKGVGPRAFKLRGMVFYDSTDVELWISKAKREIL